MKTVYNTFIDVISYGKDSEGRYENNLNLEEENKVVYTPE